jgi:hypothetical protein
MLYCIRKRYLISLSPNIFLGNALGQPLAHLPRYGLELTLVREFALIGARWQWPQHKIASIRTPCGNPMDPFPPDHLVGHAGERYDCAWLRRPDLKRDIHPLLGREGGGLVTRLIAGIHPGCRGHTLQATPG